MERAQRRYPERATTDGNPRLLGQSIYFGLEGSFSIKRITQRQLERFERRALDDITHRASLGRPAHIFRIVVHRENQHHDPWEFFDQLFRQVDSVCAVAQADIDDHSIRTQLSHQLQPTYGVASLFAYHKFVSQIQQAFESLPNNNMIVNQNEPFAMISEHSSMTQPLGRLFNNAAHGTGVLKCENNSFSSGERGGSPTGSVLFAQNVGGGGVIEELQPWMQREKEAHIRRAVTMGKRGFERIEKLWDANEPVDPREESLAAATLDKHDGIVRRNLGMSEDEVPESPLNIQVLSQNTVISIGKKDPDSA